MGGGALLIFYVTNVACYKSYFKCILSHFATDFSAQKPYLCTEIQKPPRLPGYAGGTSRSIGASPPAKITPSP